MTRQRACRIVTAGCLTAFVACVLACTGAGSGGGATGRDAGKGATEDPTRITMAKYEAALTGMTYTEVCGVLGTQGEESSRVELAGTTTVIYTWKNPDGSNMNATFQKGKLVAKAQFGLK